MPRPADRSPDAGADRATDRRRRRLAVAVAAVLLTAADTYVVVLALPEIMSGVGLGLTELGRAAPILSGFLVGYVAVLPLVGRLSDVYGRVPVLLGCLAVFVAGSVLTATAPTLGPLVVGRALQGVGGGGLVPVTLALVADGWRAERRGVPLGVVGAAQELGAVAGPLLGALVLAVTSWRGIFWGAAAGAALLALALVRVDRRPLPRPSRLVLPVLTVGTALLLLVRPTALYDDVTVGALWVPLVPGPGRWASPLGLLTLGLAAAAVAAARRRRVRRPSRRSELDLPGAALLGTSLALLVAAFASADPERQVVGDAGPLLLVGAALTAVALVVRERRTTAPLVDPRDFGSPAAWGALGVSLLLGVALMAVLVDVPVLARATRYPDDQTGAALVLLRFLVAVPVGAVVGGAVLDRLGVRLPTVVGSVLTAAGLLAMTTWGPTALDGAAVAATVALVTAGLGLGLVLSPVNAAVLAAVRPAVHGTAGALVVVARMVGMLVGLSLLTAIGLRVFAARQAAIGTPGDVCPASPTDCPAYAAAVQGAVLGELHVIFACAAACAVAAAVLAAATLGRVSSPADPLPASSPPGA